MYQPPDTIEFDGSVVTYAPIPYSLSHDQQRSHVEYKKQKRFFDQHVTTAFSTRLKIRCLISSGKLFSLQTMNIPRLSILPISSRIYSPLLKEPTVLPPRPELRPITRKFKLFQVSKPIFWRNLRLLLSIVSIRNDWHGELNTS